MRKIFDDKIIRCLPSVTVAYITIACAVVYWFMQYSGDDLSYLSAFHGLNGCATGYYDAVTDFFPRWVVRHWVYVNGRFSNNLFALSALWFPRIVNVAVVALATGTMIWLLIKLSRFRDGSVAGKMLLIAIIAFALPWWDSFMVYDVVYNYVVASVLVLGIAGVFLYRRNWISTASKSMLALWCCVSLLAGGMHEAASVPMLVAMVVYLWWTNGFVTLGKNERLVGWCFVAGAAWCFFSPGIWSRLGADVEPDDVLWLLLLKSDFLPLMLYVFLGFKACTRLGRRELKERAKTPWVVFAVASVGAFLFSAVSGIVGRSGWFASLYALIALFMWGNMSDWRLSGAVGNVAAILLAGLIAVHYFEFAKWQVRLGNEAKRLIDLYARSQSGNVYMDTTPDTDVPVWVLGKTRGVPDADDYYQKICFDGYFGGGDKKLVVLPVEIKGIRPDAVGNGIMLGNGDRVTRELPENTYRHKISREAGELLLHNEGEREYVVTPFSYYGARLYHITPRIIDPGDR